MTKKKGKMPNELPGGGEEDMQIPPFEQGEEIPPAGVEEEAGVLPQEAAPLATEAALRLSWKIAGDVTATLTDVPEAAFTEEELDELARLWAPVLPTVSPLTAAIIGTTIICGSKAVIIVTTKRKKRRFRRSKASKKAEKEVGHE